MTSFFSVLKKNWIDHKIKVRLKWFYPLNKKYKNIRSIIPSHLYIQNGNVIEENVEISSSLRILGKHVYIGKNTFISHCKSIGSFTSISFGVKIGMINHPLGYVSTSPVIKPLKSLCGR